MVNTDSDSESECFESAEESLEEEEKKIEGKPRSKKNSRESESEVAEPVNSQNEKEIETVFPEDVFVNLSYRKRPERVKRTPSVPSQKFSSRSKKSNETVFKTDVTDVFFQDITSNLSKNINKSLHTLQLTSSNVKDLILSSLPAPSATDGGNFVYDDQLHISPSSIDNAVLSNEAFVDKKIFTNDCLDESPKFLPTQNENTGVLDTLNIQGRDIDMHVIKNETLEINSEDNVIHINSDSETSHLNNSENGENIIGLDKLRSEAIIMGKLDSKLATVIDNKNETIKNSEDQVSEALKLSNEKIFEGEKNKTDLGELAINISTKNNLNLNIPESKNLSNVDANFSSFNKIVAGSVVSSTDSTGATACKQSQNYKDDIKGQKFYLDSTKKDAELNIDCKSISAQNKTNLNEYPETKFDKEGNLIDKSNERENSKDDSNVVQKQKTIYSLKNNAGGIKVDDMTKIKQNEVKDKNEIVEDGALELDFNVIESSSKNNDISNGWDDFDFSDNEIEGDMKVESHILTEGSDFVENKIDINLTAQKMPEAVSLKKYSEEENSIDKKSEEKEISEKEGFEEGWGWESWDDETDDTQEKEKPLLQKATVKNYDKAENVPDDGNKWSGWDSFSHRIEEKQGNWNLGTWGVNLLLNKATAVTQGISNVLEAGLGAPDPETLARMQKEEERQLKQEMEKIKIDEQPEEMPKKNSLTSVNLFPVSGITNLVAGVTSKIVEHTKIQEIGSKVLTGGLDTLETFGKKTMEVLQDGDPGLRNKRALLTGNNKPVLSQILREAREKADKEIKQAEEKALAKKCHFETLFDDFQGMVHLEALEMLSRQYELKLEQLKSGMSSEELEDLEGVLEEVEQLCALDDLEINSMLDLKPALQMAIEPLKEEISVEKIIQIHENANKWLQTALELETSQTLLHQKAVSTVAELTAATVHEFLKAGELLSIKECRKTVDEIDALAKFTNILCMEINKLCEKFILFGDKKSKKESDSTITISEKVIIMKNNSTSYIKQAFNLLIPVLQAGAAL